MSENTPLDVITYSTLRENLSSVMDNVSASGAHVIVTRQKAKPVVLVDFAEFQAMQETLHLLSSPRNAERLQEALEDAAAGRMVEFDPLAGPEAGDDAA